MTSCVVAAEAVTGSACSCSCYAAAYIGRRERPARQWPIHWIFATTGGRRAGRWEWRPVPGCVGRRAVWRLGLHRRAGIARVWPALPYSQSHRSDDLVRL